MCRFNAGTWFDFIGFEINETYYRLASQRMTRAMAQIRMF
jgi:hypothetical protein